MKQNNSLLNEVIACFIAEMKHIVHDANLQDRACLISLMAILEIVPGIFLVWGHCAFLINRIFTAEPSKSRHLNPSTHQTGMKLQGPDVETMNSKSNVCQASQSFRHYPSKWSFKYGWLVWVERVESGFDLDLTMLFFTIVFRKCDRWAV